MKTKLKVGDVVTLEGGAPIGRITKIRTTSSVPTAEVYWGAQDHKEYTSKIPLTGLELLVYPEPEVDEGVTVTPSAYRFSTGAAPR